MKKIWILSSLLIVPFLAGCGGGGGSHKDTPKTSYEKVKTALEGVESSFKNVSANNSRQLNKKSAWQASESTLNSLFSLFTSEDNQGDVIDDLSYNEPPMVQFQCLKYAFDKIGSGYSFDTKYFDNITGKVYVDFETGAEPEHTSAYEYDYDFVLSLGINIDQNDLITADVSFNITLSKDGHSYQSDWYVAMILDYDMNLTSPTYTLSMLTNNDERGLPYYNRCVYEYDYVDVKSNKINEWRKFDLEAPNPLVKDASHQSFDAYINEGLNYKVGVFAWYKNSSLYKAKNIQKEDNRKPQVATLFYTLGLNSTDIDGTTFTSRQGSRNSIIKTMYAEFSTLFKKDIIYSLVTRDDVAPKEDLSPKYLKIVDARGDFEVNEDQEAYLANKDAKFLDLFTNEETFSQNGPVIPKFKLFNKHNEYVKDAAPTDLAVKIEQSSSLLNPVNMEDEIVYNVNKYNSPVLKLHISLVSAEEVLDTKILNLNCIPFSEKIPGWPEEELSSLGIKDYIPAFTSSSYKANVEEVQISKNPLGISIFLGSIDYEDISNYQSKLTEMGYPEIYKNPIYGIPDTKQNKVFSISFNNNVLEIKEDQDFYCTYSQDDKTIFSELNQDVLLPEGLVFNHPNKLSDIFDYYGVSSDVFNTFINKLIDAGWKEAESPFNGYKYYLDLNKTRYCIEYENIGDLALRVCYFTQNVPSTVFDRAFIYIKSLGEMAMEHDIEGNWVFIFNFTSGTLFYIQGYIGENSTILNYENLEQNEVANKYLSKGSGNNILVTQDGLLKLSIVNEGGVNKIVCSLLNPQEEESTELHEYALVGQFNEWVAENGLPLSYIPETGEFVIENYSFINGEGFVIVEDFSWNVYYGYINLEEPYADYVTMGETNGIVPTTDFTATIKFKGGIISLIDISKK